MQSPFPQTQKRTTFIRNTAGYSIFPLLTLMTIAAGATFLAFNTTPRGQRYIRQGLHSVKIASLNAVAVYWKPKPRISKQDGNRVKKTETLAHN